ncbi:MAG: LysE family translocator [Sideroxyarcus sp.]|nr:LysE family translocator [Sideroxyarcus sp.]
MEFSLFVMALVVVYLLPGPDMILLLETGARQGKSLALATAIGLAIARSFHVALSAVGLSVLFKTEPWTFDLVRYAGSAYLIWLGIGILRANSDSLLKDTNRPMTSVNQHSIWQAIQRGLLTNLLNPKALLFCSILLPQFINPQEGNTIFQFALLGIVLVAVGLAFDLIFSISGSWLGRFMKHNSNLLRLQRWVFGTLLIGFGVRLGFAR